MYKDKLTKKELLSLQSSEVRNFKSSESLMAGIVLITMVSVFLLMVATLALVIWTNSVTMFLTGVAAIPLIFLIGGFYVVKADYMKHINKAKARINSQEKHVL